MTTNILPDELITNLRGMRMAKKPTNEKTPEPEPAQAAELVVVAAAESKSAPKPGPKPPTFGEGWDFVSDALEASGTGADKLRCLELRDFAPEGSTATDGANAAVAAGKAAGWGEVTLAKARAAAAVAESTLAGQLGR